MQTERTQQDRQEEEWSIPTNVERRENDTVKHESPRAPPPPTEDRLFTDWSSYRLPLEERTSQHNVSAGNTEQSISQTDNQPDQPRTEPARIEAMGNTLGEVMTFSSACRQPSQVGVRLIDREINMSEVGVENSKRKQE